MMHKQPRDAKGRFAAHLKQICNVCNQELIKHNRMPPSWGRICKPCANQRQRRQYREFKEEMAKDVGGYCNFCSSIDIDYHHIVPIWNHTRSHLRRNKKILMPLCRACHETWHNLKEEFDISIM